MEKSPAWEATGFSASQEIPRISQNPSVHYRIHKRPPPVTILSQIDPVHPTSRRSILILSSHLRLGLPSGLIKFHVALKLEATFKSNETELIRGFEPDARWTKTALDYVIRVIVCILVLLGTNNAPRYALFRQWLT